MGLSYPMKTVLSYIQTYSVTPLLKVINDVRSEPLRGILILILIALLAIWGIQMSSLIFILIFLAFLLYSWNSRIVAFGILVSLISCLLLLAMNEKGSSEQMAMYTYFFFVITVALQITEYWRDSWKK